MTNFSKLAIACLFPGLSWHLGAQAISPAVVSPSLSPARNALAAPRITPVVVPFSQPINPATAGNIKVFSSQYLGKRTATAGTAGNAVTLTPTAPVGKPASFWPGEAVMVTIPATVQSVAGASALPFVYQFAAATTGGSGTFTQNSYPSVGSYPYSGSLGDLDGDGDLDFIAVNGNDRTASVRFNNGLGVFSGTTTINDVYP